MTGLSVMNIAIYRRWNPTLEVPPRPVSLAICVAWVIVTTAIGVGLLYLAVLYGAPPGRSIDEVIAGIGGTALVAGTPLCIASRLLFNIVFPRTDRENLRETMWLSIALMQIFWMWVSWVVFGE